MVRISKSGERGSARLKFIFLWRWLFQAYTSVISIPVAYNAYVWKDLMQHKVDVAATQGYPASWVGDQLKEECG